MDRSKETVTLSLPEAIQLVTDKVVQHCTTETFASGEHQMRALCHAMSRGMKWAEPGRVPGELWIRFGGIWIRPHVVYDNYLFKRDVTPYTARRNPAKNGMLLKETISNLLARHMISPDVAWSLKGLQLDIGWIDYTHWCLAAVRNLYDLADAADLLRRTFAMGCFLEAASVAAGYHHWDDVLRIGNADEKAFVLDLAIEAAEDAQKMWRMIPNRN